MCGIAGAVSIKGAAVIQAMTNALEHRGPDGQGTYTDKLVSLGHRRLSIQDLSQNAHQPMISKCGEHVVIFNGEIYNHIELRESLAKDHFFQSSGDTATLLHLLKHFGTSKIGELNGIFSIAYYNRQKSIVTLIRDHFGVKPFYYYHKDAELFFASEIKAICTVPGLDLSLCFAGISSNLRFHFSPGELTPFKYIKKIEPGSMIHVRISDGKISLVKEKYYDVPFNGTYLENCTESSLKSELDILLENAVKRQLLSDVPVGFFLSGGLDSSAIVAYARKLLPSKRIRCFTIDMKIGKMNDGFATDLTYARKVAKYLDLDLEVIDVGHDITKNFDKMIYHMEEPNPDGAPLLLYEICKKARALDYKVLIGGVGGDDIFSGYRRHQALYFEQYFSRFPPNLTRVLKRLVKVVPKRSSLFRRISKLFQNIDKSTLERLFGYYTWIGDNELLKLFDSQYREVVKENLNYDFFYNNIQTIGNESSLLNQALYIELKSFLADHNLNYTDKLGMAAGVEIRVPFLDKDLVEFSTRIPPSFKMRGMQTKYILRKLMEKYLPHEVIYRSKTGFGVPGREWIVGGLKELVEARLLAGRHNSLEIFNLDAVKEIVESNLKGLVDESYTIWGLLAVQSFFEQFPHRSKFTSQ